MLHGLLVFVKVLLHQDKRALAAIGEDQVCYRCLHMIGAGVGRTTSMVARLSQALRISSGKRTAAQWLIIRWSHVRCHKSDTYSPLQRQCATDRRILLRRCSQDGLLTGI
jgi:hypothetical protein